MALLPLKTVRTIVNVQSLILIMHKQQLEHLESLNRSYQRFVPKRFLEIMDKDSITQVELGDCAQKTMSVLFSDIRSFTSLSERMSPEENFRLLNSYLSRMESVIVENHGFIDKYIGDCIMALFERTADDAVTAAINMLIHLEKYNKHRQKTGYSSVRVGIGINTGNLMVGVIGGKNYMSSSVISDAVNLSSRVEQLTKDYNVPLLITEQTYSALNDPSRYLTRFLGVTKVKGKQVPVEIYEVFDGDSENLKVSKLLTKLHFEEACLLFQNKEYYKAYILFKKCLKQSPYDSALLKYIKRCHSVLEASEAVS